MDLCIIFSQGFILGTDVESWKQELHALLSRDDAYLGNSIRRTPIFEFISSLILKTREDAIKESNSGRRMYEMGKEEERDRLSQVLFTWDGTNLDDTSKLRILRGAIEAPNQHPEKKESGH